MQVSEQLMTRDELRICLKRLDELKERLALRGFIRADATSMSTDESALPASAELDEAAAAELDREA